MPVLKIEQSRDLTRHHRPKLLVAHVRCRNLTTMVFIPRQEAIDNNPMIHHCGIRSGSPCQVRPDRSPQLRVSARFTDPLVKMCLARTHLLGVSKQNHDSVSNSSFCFIWHFNFLYKLSTRMPGSRLPGSELLLQIHYANSFSIGLRSTVPLNKSQLVNLSSRSLKSFQPMPICSSMVWTETPA
jgi:hypothetical protein